MDSRSPTAGATAEAPWLKRRDWASRRVEHAVSAVALVVLWSFALCWYGFLALMASLIWARPPAQGARAPLAILAVFAAAGLLLLVLAVRTTWHRLRFGRSWFEMDDVPFRPGGWAGGIVHAPASLHVPAFSVTLDCQEVWEGARQSTHRSVVWRDEAIVGAELLGRDSSGVYVPVSIAIPPDARPTSDGPAREIQWRLTVSAARPGLDYDASFDVPVFPANGPVPDAVRPPSPQRPADVQPPSSRIRVEPLLDGAAFQYPSPSWIRGWTIVPLLIVAASAVVGTLLFPDDTNAMLLCGAAGLAVALIMLTLTLLGVMTTPNRVEIGADTVIVRRGLFGRGWDRRIPRARVVAVKHVPQQNGPRVDHTVDIETEDGKSYNAALGLRDLAEARWLAFEIERQVGMSPRV